MYILIALVLIGWLIWYLWMKNRYTQSKPWQQFYDSQTFSPEEFYALVKEGIEKRKVPDLTISREKFMQTHVLSDAREYLKIRRNEYVFYVCSAPFGTGTFVSEWFCVWRLRFWNKIPVISKLMGKDRDDKSFYQIDTETMYRSLVHTAVIEALDKLHETKGIRSLTESERKLILG